jgi:hypothetical protein
MTNKTEYIDIELHHIYRSLAKLMSLLYINYDEFYKTLRSYYVHEVHNETSTIVRTALKCGVDRRFVKKIINNEKERLKPPYLSLIKNKLEKIARTNDHIIYKNGKKSVNSVIKNVLPGATTINTVVEELCELGYVEDKGDHIVYINKPLKPMYYDESLNIVAHFERYLHTFIYNIDCQQQSLKKFDHNVVSTQIPIESAQALEAECREKLNVFYTEINHLFKFYEHDIPESKQLEIGISLFQFNLNDV